ncbi:SDR family oxidoreductase [Oligoflexus tunisiensis]|uniref:SDR family oxidoreductase n=1 Tax=Oligoflexus tunisiensis TaxID=708132 RepID=UPI00114D3367|nr:SDR family oxidoreductase [Oligoflexus tunisiensis]
MTNRVAIVTASGKGIGAACARRLHAEGYHLGLISPSGGAQKLAEELGGCVAITGDITDSQDLRRIFDVTVETFGRLDCVVNNTGHPPKGDLLELTPQQWQLGFDLVLKTVLESSRLAVPHFQVQGGGSIINISSFAAFEPNLNFPISSVFRAALASYSKLFSQRYAKHGIRMNSVLPGFVDSFPEKEEIVAGIPAGRYGKVEEVADLVCFLAGEQRSYIQGENIKIDGGLSRGL